MPEKRSSDYTLYRYNHERQDWVEWPYYGAHETERNAIAYAMWTEIEHLEFWWRNEDGRRYRSRIDYLTMPKVGLQHTSDCPCPPCRRNRENEERKRERS